MTTGTNFEEAAAHFDELADESKQCLMGIIRSAICSLEVNDPQEARDCLLSALQECDELAVKRAKAEVMRRAAHEIQ